MGKRYRNGHVFIIILFLFSTINTSAQDSNDKDIVIGKRTTLHSKILKEDRDLFVSLPLNYKRNLHSYPVIIVMDAEYLFEITNSIVKIKTSRNEMPESIIVGVPNNTGNRYDMALELSKSDGNKFFGNNGGKSKAYLSFFRKELLPFIEKNYRVNHHRTIIGMSPTFGPVLEAFWNQPNLFDGYIVLAAELSLQVNSNETVAKKLLNAIQDNQHPKASIYIGKASKDLKRRPKEEANAFIEINQKLKLASNPNINYKIEILENEDHYGMSILGIKRGLATIYPPEVWNVPYRDFWSSKNPADELKLFYDKLSDHYGFKIIPLEDSFYASQTLSGTIRRLKRQRRNKELADILKLAVEYYPNSKELRNLLRPNK